ncbi:hypothetical protein ACJW31_11G156800 [Castanea mollissima]
MPSSVDISRQTDEILTFENIIATLSTLDSLLSEVKGLVPQSSSINNTTDKNSGSSNPNNNNINRDSLNEECLVTRRQFDKLQRYLNQIKVDFSKLKNFVNAVGEPIKNLESCLGDIFNIVEGTSNDAFPNKQVQTKLSALKNDALKLKLNIPSLPPKMSTKSSRANGSNSVVNEFPSLHMKNHKFVCSSVFTEFKEVFENLDIRLKLCLLSFAVLPEDVVVKRRLLINWWVGEGLVDPPSTGEKRAEDVADDILKELERKDFIEPVKERHKQVANRFKMQPLVHCVVIMLAQEAGFFACQFNGIPTVNSSLCNRACLVKDEDITLEKVLKSSPDLDQEKLQTIFNVNESFPDLRFESFAKLKKVSVVEWFSRMKNVNVLYLGRWKSSDQHSIKEQSSDQGAVREGSLENHIEVESTEFFEGLKNMKRLRFLSLQGISRINELPDSIGKLTNLRILDLKACHNLEALPEGLALLKKLSHLDISECYLLDSMPNGIASLTELQVLKGFVVGNLESNIDNSHQGLPRQFLRGMCFPQKRNSCTLKDLIKLKKLRKLSINTSIKDFPRKEELEALEKLKALRKLAITWSVNSDQQENGVPSAPNRHNSQQPHPKTWGLPGELEKLVLQSFPDSVSPNWLMPGKLKRLEKLYIRGGKLINLWKMQQGNENIEKWTVKILGLKYLEKFAMNMEELKTSFPNLEFLENVKCTKLGSLSQIKDVEVLYVPHDKDEHKTTVS